MIKFFKNEDLIWWIGLILLFIGAFLIIFFESTAAKVVAEVLATISGIIIAILWIKRFTKAK